MAIDVSASSPPTAQSLGSTAEGSAVLGRSMGAAATRTSQHAVRTAAGVYSFCVTEFLPPPDQAPRGSAHGTGACAHEAALPAEVHASSPGSSGADLAGRPAVAFLHGFLGCGGDWAPVAAALSLRCRCLAIDLPAHGGSRVLPGSAAGAHRAQFYCSPVTPCPAPYPGSHDWPYCL